MSVKSGVTLKVGLFHGVCGRLLRVFLGVDGL